MPPKSLDIGPGGGINFLSSQFTRPIMPSKDLSLAGKTVIVTGSNMGLGLATAEWIVELGARRLVLAVRTISKGEDAAKHLRSRYPGTNTDIRVMQLDMLSYKSIIAFVDACRELDGLDVAILNAGMADEVFRMGPHGHEQAVQINYLSTVLLAELLLPLLKDKSTAGQPGRLTIVSSGTALDAKMRNRYARPFLPTFSDATRWADMGRLAGMEQYAAGKALGHLWLLKLVDKVAAQDVIVNLVDPGYTKNTGLLKDTTGLPALVGALAGILAGRTTRVGGGAIIDAAVVKGQESHGSFLMDWKTHSYCDLAYGADGARLSDALWEETHRELAFSKAGEIVECMST